MLCNHSLRLAALIAVATGSFVAGAFSFEQQTASATPAPVVVTAALHRSGDAAQSQQLPLGSVLASYPGGATVSKEIRYTKPGSDGYFHVNIPETIRQLKRLHVNTYLFLIWHSPSDWSDFQKFLPAAKRAHIHVWAYIVPPSECSTPGRCSLPYKEDYLAWARNIARLSVKYPNLTAWAIDDFTNGKNSARFTPEYMARMKSVTDSINPKLGLYTVAYYHTAASAAFYRKYSHYITGIIFPYRNYPYFNTETTSTLPTQIHSVISTADQFGMKVMLMIYTGRYSTFPPPKPSYVKSALSIGIKYLRSGAIMGICSYGTPHFGAKAMNTVNLSMYGHGSLVLRDYGGPTPAGSYESASQTVQVNPHAENYTLSFYRYNRYHGTPTRGRVMQVLINGHVVWSSDVSTDISSGNHEYRWMQIPGPIDIDRSLLRGARTATLTFRLYEDATASYRSLTAFDNIQSSGFTVRDNGFETSNGPWKLKSNDGRLVPSIDIFDVNQPSAVFTAISRAFGGRG